MTYRSTPPSNTPSSPTGPGTTTATPTTPSTPGTDGLPGGYAGSGLFAPVGEVASAPAGGVVTTGVAAAPATGTVSSPVAVLPNTADVAAGLDALMSVSAIAGAALTAHGLMKATRVRGGEKTEKAEPVEEVQVPQE